jgi:ferredoxin
MNAFRTRVKELLVEKAVSLVIGWEEADDKTARAIFISRPADADRLILDERCVQNLALYLKKKEVRKLGRIGIIAPLHVVRSVLQLASENQVKEKDVLLLSPLPEGGLAELADFKAMQDYVAKSPATLPEKDMELLRNLERMTPEERFTYWRGQFAKCIKCYACRAACPMCFCGRCQVEYNQPQIITVEATPLGNLEWHFMRAMHLAGRCVNCGECGRSCPVGIPVHLLSFKTCESLKESFDAWAGVNAEMRSVMSDFKPEDKETFIQ